MDNSYSSADRIQELLEYLKNFHRQNNFDHIGIKPALSMSPFEKIQYTRSALLTGALPNAETLEYIAISFDKYISQKGQISLDEAFGLKSKPKAGNPSRQYANKTTINNMLFDMACIRRDNPNITIENAALQICEVSNNHDKSSTLCREYSRGNWADIEALIPKVTKGK
jgi:hypothetical protein